MQGKLRGDAAAMTYVSAGAETHSRALDIGILFVRTLQGTPSASRIFRQSSLKCGAVVCSSPGVVASSSYTLF